MKRTFKYQSPDKVNYNGAFVYVALFVSLVYFVFTNEGTLIKVGLGLLALVMLFISIIMLRYYGMLRRSYTIELEDENLKLSQIGFSEKGQPSVPLVHVKGAGQPRYEWIESIEKEEIEGGVFLVITLGAFEQPVIYRLNAKWFEREGALEELKLLLEEKVKAAKNKEN